MAKGKHGGKRKGAGRPPLRPGRPAKTIVRYCISMPRELGEEIDQFIKIAKMDDTVKMGRSAFLEMAAKYYLDNITGRAEE